MNKLVIPDNYQSKLNLIETEEAVKKVKDLFQTQLSTELKLKRISAPLFVYQNSGLNDDLNGSERPIVFDIKHTGENAVIVHSLAKWKRMALKRYNFVEGEGIYCDMNAIRRDEEFDNLHSIYVDQWDWEKIINIDNRKMTYFELCVKKIMHALKNTEGMLNQYYTGLEQFICEEIFFISTQELENAYPKLNPKEREYEICKQYKSVCITQIGNVLASGIKHDGRAPDYDDWSMNGDILIYYPLLDCAVEISSMGIRVDSSALKMQLKKCNCEEKAQLPFHRALINSELPLTIGGGIGQSRICLLLLNKAHIGEVQASLWDEKTMDFCANKGIELL